MVKLSFTDFFAFRPVTVTRGHQYKLYVNHSRGIRKHFFTERVVANWNSLPADTDFTVPLQCLWRDSVTLISTLLLTYLVH